MLAEKRLPDDCVKNNCNYTLGHYHCVIPDCGERVLVGDGDPKEEFHPCCSLVHIKIYNENYTGTIQ